MLGWWKKLVGPRSVLPAPSEALLQADLRQLDALGGGVGERALRYVLDGSDAEVVDFLASRAGGGRALKLKCVDRQFHLSQSEREKFFAELPRQDASFYLRLALVFEAASRRDPRTLVLDWVPGAPPWLEILLWEASSFRHNMWSGNTGSFLDFETAEGMLALAGSSPEIALRAALFPTREAANMHPLLSLVLSMKGLGASATRHPAVVEEALRQAEARSKVHVLGLLSRHGVDPAPHAAVLSQLAAAPAKTVRSMAQALLRSASLLEEAVDAGPADDAGDAALRLAPLAPPVPGRLPRSVRDALERLALDWEQKALAGGARIAAQTPHWKPPTSPRVTPALIDRIFELMQAPRVEAGALSSEWTPATDWRSRLEPDDAKALLQHDALELVHVVRFLAAIGAARPWQRAFQQGRLPDRWLRQFRSLRQLDFGLREVGAAFDASGLDGARVGWSRLDAHGQPAFTWEAEAVWPYFVERPEILDEALELAPPRDEKDMAWARPFRRSNALSVLEGFPRVPSRLKPRLWEIALGSAKSDRGAAQRCLQKEPDTIARAVAALADGKQDVRCVAAAWLVALGHRAAIPEIRAALKREKQDAAKAALMDALEALGAPVDEFLDRPGLAAEAAKGLKKGLPPALAWFPFDRLPAVRWADTGARVPSEVVTWFVVQSHKRGSPEAGALLRRYAQSFHPADREELGRFVLEAWIAEDVHLPTPQEVQVKAQQLAKQVLSFYKGQTLQQLAQSFARDLANQPQGSAAAHKGVLALAGACSGAAAAPLVQQYLKKWYGFRAAQCRALLQMLSRVEHPAAIQVVLGTASRFRTAGIRKEAEQQAHLIAERKGWTVAELADRTIPTAGFDDGGELQLDYGQRRFVARIEDDLSVSLSTAEGKPIAALPEPRAGESEEAAAAAKKALADAKKELKATVKLQRERLYEAMCTQREWSLEDWQTYLHHHPIVGRYCRRLAWTAHQGERWLGSFRPLGDGSLTDPHDAPLTLPAGAVVHLAHGSNTPAEEGRAWKEHFAAYEVEPLFDQFGRDVYRATADMAEQTRVRDHEGHMLQAFKLRSRATKLGYLRGAAEDAGWFYVYRKSFPTLGLDAVIEFTGNRLPEEDRPVALRSLHFARGDEECALGEVPAVLLSECWNDLRTIAAEGSGFDPEWEKKAQP